MKSWLNKLLRYKRLNLLASISRVILGLVFIYASIDKIAFPHEFTKVIQGYDVLPDVLVRTVSIVLPWMELILGTFLVAGILVKESAFILSGLVIIFMLASGIQTTRGFVEDCGCFPEIGFLSTSDIWMILIRDTLFLILGIFILAVEIIKSSNDISDRVN
jgi:uncharacterized membrane protein YphA (DoxX/SURF4 family)